MSETNHTFRPDHKMRDLMESGTSMLSALNRFKIPFGFGTRTIAEVCKENDIDLPTFLAVVNTLAGNNISRSKLSQISLPALISFLRETHAYIIEYMLPEIRDILIKGIHLKDMDQKSGEALGLMILRFYDEYIEEVRSHIHYEDETVFGYIEGLLEGRLSSEFRIADFADRHDSMDAKLTELKEIFMQHCQVPNSPQLYRALVNIMACGEDLVSHCRIEEMLLIPAAAQLEAELMEKMEEAGTIDDEGKEDGEALTKREIEIIRLVAHGYANKEIADKLCLSFHTVTTYRKKISAKLNIHSSAALAIYAVLHNIIDLSDIQSK